ncbi:hypothetical protein P154DRAFT_137895 [Amniculicola lignicola CBS 123094]|uniref:Uncharacterized protein n=1 Tax=Amniculicola lignicola CBS 123094 TaxID=1392246 RepID=A0A6A5VVD7_9PLEO|nr:hypothetical protein P154DRAFT_137895 [Amniculicola lignicola CBS 123094]
MKKKTIARSAVGGGGVEARVVLSRLASSRLPSGREGQHNMQRPEGEGHWPWADSPRRLERGRTAAEQVQSRCRADIRGLLEWDQHRTGLLRWGLLGRMTSGARAAWWVSYSCVIAVVYGGHWGRCFVQRSRSISQTQAARGRAAGTRTQALAAVRCPLVSPRRPPAPSARRSPIAHPLQSSLRADVVSAVQCSAVLSSSRIRTSRPRPRQSSSRWTISPFPSRLPLAQYGQGRWAPLPDLNSPPLQLAARRLPCNCVQLASDCAEQDEHGPPAAA